jgi:ribose 5-phosphate isomerase A
MNDKQTVAQHVADIVENNMIVGLGTGSTANYFIEALAQRQLDEGLTVQCVSSSVVSAIKAREAGLSVLAIEQIEHLDLYVDGADEITLNKVLLKGRGYDLVREKLLASLADEFLVVADESKLVSSLGEHYPIPVEVMPFAWKLVQSAIHKQAGEATLRPNSAHDGLAITSHGSLVLDVRFPVIDSITELNRTLSAIPGVVEHGIFESLASRVFIAKSGQVNEL